MSIAGIIAEYNPFHNGHKYHIQKAKELTGASHVIVIMSGNFVQRGTPAIIDKYCRTRMALCEGADIVIELPYTAALSSAKDFAYTAVGMLCSMGCVSHLVFGSECNNLPLLNTITDILTDESIQFKNALSHYLKAGLTYPKARYLAVCEEMQDKTVENVLNMPNNILGIEYLCALKELNSTITPYTILRSDSGYLDHNLSTGDFSSALAIRNDMTQGTNSLYQKYIPHNAAQILNNYITDNSVLIENDFSQLLYSKLAYILSKENNIDLFLAYQDVNEDIANSIKNNFSTFNSFTDFSTTLKSKNYTKTRIDRILMHILLECTKEHINTTRNTGFGKLLGFNKSASSILRKIQDESSFKIITKSADAEKTLTPQELSLYTQGISNDNAYYYINYQKSIIAKKSCIRHNEITRNIIIN